MQTANLDIYTYICILYFFYENQKLPTSKEKISYQYYLIFWFCDMNFKNL